MATSTRKRVGKNGHKRTVRYAVVGQGYISQIAVLPAFEHADDNSELVAIVSDDAAKLRKLSKEYDVDRTYTYDQYDECLASGIDAVYVALPNTMHAEYTIRATRAGVHVLCEKPMEVTAAKCQQMIRAAAKANVKLMIAYRLHFEEANLRAQQIVHSGKLGEPRIFASQFTMQVKAGNIRLQKKLGGGTLYDIGIYCINAARAMFRAEPFEVMAFSTKGNDRRFAEVDEMTSAIMRFSGDRVATFTCSFGAADGDNYQVIGTKGDIIVSPAYTLSEGMKHTLTVDGNTTTRKFPKRDQFAPELLYFSDCVLRNLTPEPSGEEGLADVRVIEALLRSARTRRPVRLTPFQRKRRPTMSQEIRRPPIDPPELFHAQNPTGD